VIACARQPSACEPIAQALAADAVTSNMTSAFALVKLRQ
jgi:hypothetical protein